MLTINLTGQLNRLYSCTAVVVIMFSLCRYKSTRCNGQDSISLCQVSHSEALDIVIMWEANIPGRGGAAGGVEGKLVSMSPILWGFG